MAQVNINGRVNPPKPATWYAQGPPTMGTHTRADVVWNTHPFDGSPVGWICTGSGSPGVWWPFGFVGSPPAAGPVPVTVHLVVAEEQAP